MIWNFTDRRDLPVRDYVWSYAVESCVKSLATPCVTELETDEKLDVKTGFLL